MRGAAIIGGILLVVIIGALVVNAIIGGLGLLEDKQAQREYAKAVRVEAEKARDHQASVDWQHEFMLWTIALESIGGLDVISLLIIGAAYSLFGTVVYWIHKTSGG